MKLNESQLRSADHFTGPSLILAGPGSGKTAVITYRIKNLIEKYHVAPGKILVASFSRAAAEEMEERFSKISSHSGQGPFFGTFHSIFFSLLKKESGYQNNKILTEQQKIEILRSEMIRLHIEFESSPELYRNILNDISRIKSGQNQNGTFLPLSLPAKSFYPLCKAYLQTTKAMDVMDYDDILLKCYALLKDRPDLLEYYRNRYPFILIDEFQDINPVQYEIMKLLSYPLQNIFVVGDDDQCIYRFRGASPGVMKQFLKDYPDAVVHVLNINYRSSLPIVSASTAVIRGNKDRFEKKMVCSNTVCSSSSFVLKKFKDGKEEYAAIIEEIKTYRKNGGVLSEIAILFRNRSDGRRLARRLGKEKIPVHFQGESENIFSGFLAQDLQAYMQCAKALASSGKAGTNDENLQTRANLLQILNKPSRYISRTALLDSSIDDSLPILFSKLNRYYQGNSNLLSQIQKLKKDLLFLSELSPFASITYILQAVGYDRYLKEYAKAHQIPFEELEEELEDLLEICKNFSSLDELMEFIEESKIEESKTEELKTEASKNKIPNYKSSIPNTMSDKNDSKPLVNTEAVWIMTMHASKGLEFNIVYLPDLNQNVIPGKRADTKEAIAEERRILYVAMTRAKKSLRIGYTEIIRNKKAAPSEFLDCFFH